ncbi:MAG: hypothetical protein KC729_19115, partial [Candidatus Eisenbacteria bacterium]|nr:hypothetical protein [Candidatus Eisenbacteria bacterium]
MSARAGRWIAAVGCGALLVCSSAGGAEAGRPHPFWFDLLPPVGDSALVRPEIDPEALPPGCEFPQTITIRGDNLLLVRVGNDTIPFFDRGVEIDYRDGELIIDGIHTRPQPTRLTDAALERMYSKVPYLQEQVAAGSTWGEAADVYFDSTSAIW